MDVVAGIRAGAFGFKAFPPASFSGSGVGIEPRKWFDGLSQSAALTVAGAAQVARLTMMRTCAKSPKSTDA